MGIGGGVFSLPRPRQTRPPQPLLPTARDRDDVHLECTQRGDELLVKELACGACVTDAVGDPGDVDVQKQIELRLTVSRLVDDPLRTLAIVMSRVDDGTDEVRVEDLQPRPLFRELSSSDRLDVVNRQLTGNL